MIVTVFLSYCFMDIYTNPLIVPWKRLDLLITQLIILPTNEASVAFPELNQSDCMLFIYSYVLTSAHVVLGASQVKPMLTCSGMRTLLRASH